jgi:hypothetical protein
MGLDQYLHASKYTSGTKWSTAESNALYQSIIELAKIGDFVSDEFPSASIQVKVAYWRKANAVHGWFVKNCQDGFDNCQTSYVSRDQLTELVDICKKVLADNSLASELLPVQEGFFFGGTEYDEWYMGNVQYTADTIEKLLTLPEDWDFNYSSSW